jgi:2-phospho-L-lactate guanylyltransferase
VLPVKGGIEAKTRLGSPGGADGGALALAFARDLLGAVLAVPEALGVIVVSSNVAVRDLLRADGATLVTDPGRGLNQAVLAGMAAARDAHPNAGVVVMLADLPCVTAHEVSAAFAAASGPSRSFLRDAEGTGTTLIAVAPGVTAEPLFGPMSAARHAAAGFVELTLPADARIRLDVDTPEDLAVAVMVGVGPHTRAALG